MTEFVINKSRPLAGSPNSSTVVSISGWCPLYVMSSSDLRLWSFLCIVSPEYYLPLLLSLHKQEVWPSFLNDIFATRKLPGKCSKYSDWFYLQTSTTAHLKPPVLCLDVFPVTAHFLRLATNFCRTTAQILSAGPCPIWELADSVRCWCKPVSY